MPLASPSRLTARADLRSERGQRVAAVAQRAELCFRSGEVVEHHDRPAIFDTDVRGEGDRPAAGADERECLLAAAAEGDLALKRTVRLVTRERCTEPSLTWAAAVVVSPVRRATAKTWTVVIGITGEHDPVRRIYGHAGVKVVGPAESRWSVCRRHRNYCRACRRR